MVASVIKWDESTEYEGPTIVLGYNPTDGKPPYIGQRLEDLCGCRGRIISYAKRNSFIDWVQGKTTQYEIEVGYLSEIKEVQTLGRRRKIRRTT